MSHPPRLQPQPRGEGPPQCLGTGWSPAGSPGAFLGASPGPAPPSGAGVPLLLLLGSARSMPPARARAARSPQCVSKKAEEQLEHIKVLCTGTSRPHSTPRQDPRLQTAPAFCAGRRCLRCSSRSGGRAGHPGLPLAGEASAAAEGLSARNECLEEPC